MYHLLWLQLSTKTVLMNNILIQNHSGGLVSGNYVQAAKRKGKEHLSYHLPKATSKSETEPTRYSHTPR